MRLFSRIKHLKVCVCANHCSHYFALFQVGMTAPGTRRHIYDTKTGTEKCDNSTMSLQMGYNQGANQSGQSFGLGRQIYDPKYCPKGNPDDLPHNEGDEQQRYNYIHEQDF